MVLEYKEDIIKMLKINKIEKLETVEDVLKFGNLYVNNGLLKGFK